MKKKLKISFYSILYTVTRENYARRDILNKNKMNEKRNLLVVELLNSQADKM